ncbi:Aminopeptidase [bacterium HR29]|nr:Aminopeptidase [bacterium HR29]
MSIAVRLQRLRAEMAREGLDALLVTAPVDDVSGRHSANRRYLTGFTGSAGMVLVTGEAAFLAVDARYWEQAAEQVDREAVRIFRLRGRSSAWWRELVAEAGIVGKRVGCSPNDTTLSVWRRLTEANEALPPGERPELLVAPPLVERLRRVKDEGEIAALTRAAAIADAALGEAAELVHPGVTEAAVAEAVGAAIRKHGGEGPSFATIVAGGVWAALPHAYPRDVPFREGDAVVIDMGAVWQGYCSDITRTFAAGRGNPKFAAVYEVVLEAQLAAIDGIRSGMTGEEAYRLAADVIERRGYGEYFTHGLGHGVGLDVHEDPYLGPNSEDRLEDGMVFTIEPGIYIPAWGGVRIEDMVVLEGGRARVLTGSPKGVPHAARV